MHQAASRYGCTTLVELGCYDGRSLEVARAAGTDYLGVDVNAAAVERVCRRIADEGLHGRARAVVGDAMRCADWLGELDGGRPCCCSRSTCWATSRPRGSCSRA